MVSRFLPAVAAALLTVPLLAGCAVTSSATTDSGTVTVTATDTECLLSTVTAPAGTIHFSVTNTGSRATEFSLLDSDGHQVASGMENVGPARSSDLVLTAPAGHYVTDCRLGGLKTGILGEFLVS